MTEEELKKIDEIKKRWATIPRRMAWKETNIPRMVSELIPDPQNPGRFKPTGRSIPDPRGAIAQNRSDVIDLDDPYQFTLIHFHKPLEHPQLNPRADEMGGAFIEAPRDIDFLISILEEKKNGT